MAQEFHIEFAPRTAVHVEDAEPLGEVQVLVERVTGNPTQEQINTAVAAYIEEHPGAISGLTDDIKQALLQIARKIPYLDDDDDYYQDLYDALYPPVAVTSIEAVFTQGTTVIYDTDDLDALKNYLVVTANYNDGTSETVSNYTLTGTLTTGTSTITATYGGKSDTFTVTVTHDSRVMLYNWDFTQSLTDTIQGQTAVLGRKTGANPVRDEFGIHITTSTGYVNLGDIYQTGITVEMDFGEVENKQTNNARVLMVGSVVTSGLQTGFIYRSTGVWNWYVNGSWCTSSGVTDANIFSNKTLKAVFDETGYMTVYADGTLIGTSSKAFTEAKGTTMQICANSGNGAYCSFYDMTVKALRIYTEEGGE